MQPTTKMARAPDIRPRLRAVGLTLPLVAFVGVTFVAPLTSMLIRSIYDPVVADALPETLALLDDWDGSSVPAETVFEAASRELATAQQQRLIGRVAGRVNRVQGGLRSVLVLTGRRLGDASGDSWRERMAGINPAWEEVGTWHALRTAGERFTARHYLAAIDLTRLPDGSVVRQAPDRRIYVPLFVRTLMVSLGVTLLCLVLGYPLAHLIAHSPPRRGGILLALVLVPFWTSLLVRTTAWIVLLQNQGVINDLLVTVGLVAGDARLALIYNMIGTFVAMTHVLLPFMVLPLYSVMRTIPRSHMSAAASLGAGPLQAFGRIYWPQSIPGVGAGCLLVFILAIGYYITPALVGGSSGQLISNMVAYHMQTSLDWGLASALGAIILVCVTGLYILYDRIAGGERVSVA